jgi:hypothetical protein
VAGMVEVPSSIPARAVLFSHHGRGDRQQFLDSDGSDLALLNPSSCKSIGFMGHWSGKTGTDRRQSLTNP